ncbi:non-ribosomal peptide synthetase [Streptomyces sp. H27-D2]|uniref:non-ribosomal peptide synthetase n=1 Tax=Streptomyces sp. H27-D2 TaxID=3046304 RepID=UPI002DB68B89|nr:non-ribosomal peptide synthetase [Streptomyces sp. H27-D2]MEC4020331.1 non-ribosomal peptide synthetase [Streptomyces sp. H27-D2]
MPSSTVDSLSPESAPRSAPLHRTTDSGTTDSGTTDSGTTDSGTTDAGMAATAAAKATAATAPGSASGPLRPAAAHLAVTHLAVTQPAAEPRATDYASTDYAPTAAHRVAADTRAATDPRRQEPVPTVPQSADPAAHSGGLSARVARHAQSHPTALAVSDDDTTLTYAQLHSAAGRLAARLHESGVRAGDTVGLLAARSARTVVTQLAVWRVGATCVPLDAAHPRPRTAAMLEDAAVTLTLGDKALLEAAGIAAERFLVLSADSGVSGDQGDSLDRGDDTHVPQPAAYDPHGTAFVMFTSGSTGRPKGVALTHRAIADLVTDPDYVTVTPRDRVLFHSSTSFDASTFEVWVALANGAAVVVSAAERPSLEELARDVERHGATLAFFTTALFHQLAARRSRLFGVLRTVVVGGEAMAAQPAATVLDAFPWLELVNGYGPTETTTFATAHRVSAEDCASALPPIGRPIAGTTAHVLDERREPVVTGERGELWIGGPRLARGYVGQPAMTAERFVEHPAHGRLYRTGDVVSSRPDGTLDFHARADDQVKVRGFRIEPGEIEHVLRGWPEVDDAAVAVRRPTPEDTRLAAFIVPAPGPAPKAEALRARLAERLPAHLVPDEWTVVERLPMTASGKVDRLALTAPTGGTGPVGAAPVELPPIERVVADIWTRSLGHEVSRADVDFFALGGHSLLALAVVDDLREDLGVELSLTDFFAAPTVAGHAALIERALLDAHGDLDLADVEFADGDSVDAEFADLESAALVSVGPASAAAESAGPGPGDSFAGAPAPRTSAYNAPCNAPFEDTDGHRI